MFSEELLELDRNTVEFMIEDMRRQIEEKDEQIKQKDEQLRQLDEQIKQLDEQIRQRNNQIKENDNTYAPAAAIRCVKNRRAAAVGFYFYRRNFIEEEI